MGSLLDRNNTLEVRRETETFITTPKIGKKMETNEPVKITKKKTGVPPSNAILTQEYLRSVWDYNPTTGIFTRIKRTSYNGNIGDIGGSLNKVTGYKSIYICGKLITNHRLAVLYMTGKLPTYQVDHIDMDRTNNAWTNLRQCTNGQNMANASLRVDNTTGIKGLCWDKYYSKWKGQISINGSTKSYSHKDREVVIGWLNKLRPLVHGEFARTA